MTKFNKIISLCIAIILTGNIFAQEIGDPTMMVTSISAITEETSGLIYYNNKLWTHNDSDNAPELYSIDSITGEVLETKVIRGVANIDWEDLAIDATHLYIGDFGNNGSGTRNDMRIIRIKLEDLENPELDTLDSRIISFRYDSSFYPGEYTGGNNTQFDCEAMFAKDDTIFLISKNWINHDAYLFAVPNKANITHTIFPRDTLNFGYLVTGADYNYESNTVALCGYTYETSGAIPDSKPYITLITDFAENKFFDGTITTKVFTSPSGIISQQNGITYNQIEGITFRDKNRLWVSNEKYSKSIALATITIPPHLRNFPISGLVSVNNPATYPVFDEEEGSIVVDFEANDTLIFTGNYITFSENCTENPTSYSWYFAGGTPSTSNFQVPAAIKYNIAGTYCVSLQAENRNSISSLRRDNYIHVIDSARAMFDCELSTICTGGTAEYLNFSTPDTECFWTFEGGTPETSTERNPIVTYNNAGLFNVSLIVRNELSADTIVREHMIEVIDHVIADFTIEQEETVAGEPINFIDRSQNAASWMWIFEGGEPEMSNLQNPVVTYYQGGSHNVSLTAISERGICSDIKTAEISFSFPNNIEKNIKGFDIYPNPTENVLNITTDGLSYDYEIFNIKGKSVIKSKKIVNGNTSIDISKLKPGEYFIKVKTSEQEGRYGFIKL